MRRATSFSTGSRGGPILSGAVSGAPEIPETSGPTLLLPNHPNPFGASTLLRFVLPEPAVVQLTVYDVNGRRVATLIESERREAGLHEVPFEAADQASGVYACRLEAGPRQETLRLVHIR